MRRLILGLSFTLLGFFCFSFGWAGLVSVDERPQLSDEQVIERAKELGMVDIKEALEIEERENKED